MHKYQLTNNTTPNINCLWKNYQCGLLFYEILLAGICRGNCRGIVGIIVGGTGVLTTFLEAVAAI